MTAETPSLAGAGGGFTSQADQRAFAESVRTFAESVRKFADEPRGGSADAMQPFVTSEKQTATANQLASGDYTAAMQGDSRPQSLATDAGLPPIVQQQRNAMLASGERARSGQDVAYRTSVDNLMPTMNVGVNKAPQPIVPTQPIPDRPKPPMEQDWEVPPEGQRWAGIGGEDDKQARQPPPVMPLPIRPNQPTALRRAPDIQLKPGQAAAMPPGFDALRRQTPPASMDMGNTFTPSLTAHSSVSAGQEQDRMTDTPIPVKLVGTTKLIMDSRGDIMLAGAEGGGY
jgi:hypothetical protein